MRRPIVISSGNELIRVFPERIVYISSDGNYSTMILHDKTEHLFTMNLSHFQKLIEEQLEEEASIFIRIGKSLIINRSYIYKINISKQLLVLSDIILNGSFMLNASKEALKQLKLLIENEETGNYETKRRR
ncbi:MAG: LytTR family transcriptional regulator DNA-binding domain-containing protein [Bacteroides sp.]|nr:LytTR family transcriptional regulator DNA-binding domain-containing protein [Bacteroides sp.]